MVYDMYRIFVYKRWLIVWFCLLQSFVIIVCNCILYTVCKYPCQICDLLQHLCDCQLQHRVEAIVKFAHQYSSDLRAVCKVVNTKLMYCSILCDWLTFSFNRSRRQDLRKGMDYFYQKNFGLPQKNRLNCFALTVVWFNVLQ